MKKKYKKKGNVTLNISNQTPTPSPVGIFLPETSRPPCPTPFHLPLGIRFHLRQNQPPHTASFSKLAAQAIFPPDQPFTRPSPVFFPARSLSYHKTNNLSHSSNPSRPSFSSTAASTTPAQPHARHKPELFPFALPSRQPPYHLP